MVAVLVSLGDLVLDFPQLSALRCQRRKDIHRRLVPQTNEVGAAAGVVAHRVRAMMKAGTGRWRGQDGNDLKTNPGTAAMVVMAFPMRRHAELCPPPLCRHNATVATT
ncbi:unnamed protein product [Ectocarpus sp. 12 AP-2014]